MSEHLCANCKWEISAVYDESDEIYRCSDCGSEILGYETEANECHNDVS